MPSSTDPSRSTVVRALLAIALLVAIGFALHHGLSTARAEMSHHAGMPMSDAEMARATDAWYSVHPAHAFFTGGVVVDTFLVSSFIFDTDGNLATQVDTAKVNVGDAILWKWVNGIHTVTSGTGSADLIAGSHFDQPISLTAPSVTVSFDTAGTYNFFCRPHGDFFNMKGVVVVRTTVGVPPSPAPRAGFVRDPAPNPSRDAVSFRFALATAGRARAEVFDVRGRRVAVLLDRDLPAGESAATWDGRAANGVRSSAGVYYVRLSVPGFTGGRSITLEP